MLQQIIIILTITKLNLINGQGGGFGLLDRLPPPPQLSPLLSSSSSSSSSSSQQQQLSSATLTGISQLKNTATILTQNIQSFQDFLAITGKKYSTKTEEIFRRSIFAIKQKLVEKFNKSYREGKINYQLSLNKFSDLTKQEYLKGLTGRKLNSDRQSIPQEEIEEITSSSTIVPQIPDSFDWREKGAVTPVKFQGLDCGACWSFATTGAIEGHYFRKTGQLISLSEQNLVDCSVQYGNTGCDGGFQDYGFEYVINNGGISRDDVYPYLERQDMCKYDKNYIGANINGYAVIEPRNETRIKEIIATLGPVAASVNADPDSFQLYKSGIYRDTNCNNGEVNHSVLIVGYGTEKNGEDYWIIKNSWTDKWGEGGYMKLPRNANNFCGIADECSYPII